MLGTEWVAPGQGSTVRELLDVAPSRIIDGAEWSQLKPVLDRPTSLRLNGEELQPYDLERISDALGRMA